MLKNKDLIQLLPLFIISGSILLSLMRVLQGQGTFGLVHYISFLLLVGCYGLYFVNQKIYRFVTVIVLILSTLNILQFSNLFSMWFNFSYSSGSTSIELGINPFQLIVLGIFIYIIRDTKALNPAEVERARLAHERQVNIWKEEYREYPMDKLEYLAQNPSSLNDHAQEALVEILNEKSQQ